MVATGNALDSLVAALKSWKPTPHELRVTLLDGETTTVAVSAARNKWARLRDVMSSLEWARVEGLTKTGSLVGLHEHPDLDSLTSAQATELEEIEVDRNTAAVYNLTRLVEQSADRAVDRVGQHHEMVLNSALRVIEVLSERLVQSEAQSAAHLQSLHDLMRANGDSEEAETMALALKAGMQLLQSNNAKKATKTKKNGAA